MQQVVTITSQGQITIPAKMRRKGGFGDKAIIEEKGDGFILKPVKDFRDLAGAYKHKALKGLSFDEIREREKSAMGEAIAEKYRKKMKRDE